MPGEAEVASVLSKTRGLLQGRHPQGLVALLVLGFGASSGDRALLVRPLRRDPKVLEGGGQCAAQERRGGHVLDQEDVLSCRRGDTLGQAPVASACQAATHPHVTPSGPPRPAPDLAALSAPAAGDTVNQLHPQGTG